MVEIRFARTTSAPAAVVLAAATDFSPRRPQLWTALDAARYQVHAVGTATAEVTEGSAVLGGVWARERYDWATPGTVRAEVQESNVFKPGSSWELRVAPVAGGSRVQWIARRQGQGFKGRLLVLMLRMRGRALLAANLQATLTLLEGLDSVDEPGRSSGEGRR
ncbi:MAG: SRPBCC family protein [Actinomycetota bacterium]|nr:SRPBCC family protein [Actinomycetota bacterium]